MADKLIGKTQRPVDHSLVIEDNSILERTSACQSSSHKKRNIIEESESSSRSDFLNEGVLAYGQADLLLSNSRVIVVNSVADPEIWVRGRFNRCPLFLDEERFCDFYPSFFL
jgi:hypothetical protein